MAGITRFVTDKLRLQVNEDKSAVATAGGSFGTASNDDRRRTRIATSSQRTGRAGPWNRKFLGFSFTPHRQPKRRLAPATVQRFKAKVRELTDTSNTRRAS